MNFWDILIIVIIIGIIVGVSYKKRKDIKNGKGGCCHQCSCCVQKDDCH